MDPIVLSRTYFNWSSSVPGTGNYEYLDESISSCSFQEWLPGPSFNASQRVQCDPGLTVYNLSAGVFESNLNLNLRCFADGYRAVAYGAVHAGIVCVPESAFGAQFVVPVQERTSYIG